MIKIDLTEAEAADLKQVLENKLTALLNELAHTDDRDYRVYVRGSITTIEQIQAKLREGLAQGVRATA